MWIWILDSFCEVQDREPSPSCLPVQYNLYQEDRIDELSHEHCFQAPAPNKVYAEELKWERLSPFLTHIVIALIGMKIV